MRITVVLTLIGGLIASTAYAVDGALEINQACAAGPGCFAGDTAGFPVQITTRGSYRLTSNLTPPNQTTATISIFAGGVSVDLNGFAIQGTIPCSAGAGGFGVTSITSGAAVSNGHVRGMGSVGINLGLDSRVERVIAEQNCGGGIAVGNGSLVSDSVARSNAGHGIVASPSSRINGSVADLNTGNGISGPGGAVSVEGCVANGNGFNGISLLSSLFGSLVIDSMASNNTLDGILVDANSLVLRSSTNGNGIYGIEFVSTGPNNFTSGVGFVTANGNVFDSLNGFLVQVACSVRAGVQSCP